MTELLSGKRILIVEDEYFIAADLKRALTQYGAEIVGPVGDLAAGLALAEEQLDAAVLDVNLEEALSYPIADRLRSNKVPYLFLTGYDGWSLPTAYQDDARLAKPFAIPSVIRTIEGLLSAEGVTS